MTNAFYSDGYQDAKSKAPYNPPEQPDIAAQYRDGWEDYIFESASFSRLTAPLPKGRGFLIHRKLD